MANANPNPANVPVVEAAPVPVPVPARTYYNMLRNTGVAVRNRALYPAGRWLRNVGGPRTRNAVGTGAIALRNRALYPAGRWLRNVGGPRPRNAVGTGAIALRNRALYPAARWTRNVAAPAAVNFTRRCLGAACRRGAAAAASLGFDIRLDDGLTITARDRAIMAVLPAVHGTAQFSAFNIAQLEDNLNERVNEDVIERSDQDFGNAEGNLSVAEYKSLVPTYARDLKTLYMMKLVAMEIDDSEIISLSNNAAAGILMQIHLLHLNEAGNHQVEYERFTEADLQPLLDELRSNNSNSNSNSNNNNAEAKSTSGGRRRSTRRRRNRRSTRRF